MRSLLCGGEQGKSGAADESMRASAIRGEAVACSGHHHSRLYRADCRIAYCPRITAANSRRRAVIWLAAATLLLPVSREACSRTAVLSASLSA